jgi:hypothetical protein
MAITLKKLSRLRRTFKRKVTKALSASIRKSCDEFLNSPQTPLLKREWLYSPLLLKEKGALVLSEELGECKSPKGAA